MKQAAALEDKTEKHPVTPGEIKPAGEWLGDMLMELNRPAEALKTYLEVLHKHPNRFNTVYGCAVAAEKSGDLKSAKLYFNQLLVIAEGSSRPEITHARMVLKN
jgi:tetratricopeptide (TPR) repeat protein